jgi:FkbM family methyltransferase
LCKVTEIKVLIAKCKYHLVFAFAVICEEHKMPDENCNVEFYNKIRKRGFNPKVVAEVGVWHPNTSNVYSFIDDDVETILVEPDPKSIELIKEKWGNKINVTLYEVALCDFDGEIQLCQRDSSTFVSSLPNSPALVNDNCNIEDSENFMAKALKFSNIDNGLIELISIDTEGSEWFVVKNMISRPMVISIETHGGMYVNPYINELKQWMNDNNYTLWFKDKSDSTYVLNDKITLTPFDKINLVLINILIKLKAIKKRISKKIRNHS